MGAKMLVGYWCNAKLFFLFQFMYAFKSQNCFGQEAIINGCGILCLFLM